LSTEEAGTRCASGSLWKRWGLSWGPLAAPLPTREHERGLRQFCQKFGRGHDPYLPIENALLPMKMNLVEIRDIEPFTKIAQGS
jgi:hypothetical protein